MTRYVIDLRDLGADRVQFEGSAEVGSFGGEEIVLLDPVRWSGFAERAGAEIRVAGRVETRVALSCARCLDLLSFRISRDFDLFFRQRDTLVYDEDDEIELGEGETNTAFFTGTELSVLEILREQMLLAMPMKPLCQADCKGLCPSCGVNLNLQSCSCPREDSHRMFEALSDIKRKMEERS